MPDTHIKLTLGELCEFINGNGFRPPDWSDKGLPIIRIQNLNGSREFNYFSGNPKERWLVQPGDILFAWAGVKGVSFGPTIWPGPIGVLNQHIFRVVPRRKVDRYWLYAALKFVTGRIEARAHGFKSSLLHVQRSEIVDQIIDVPPLEEQRAIAKVLSTWDDAIAKSAQLISLKEARCAELSRRLLERCVLSNAAVDSRWKMYHLGILFDERDERGNDSELLLAITGNRGVVDRNSIERRDTSNDDKSKYKLICPGDIGYNTMRMWQGVCGLSSHRGIVSPAYTVVTPRRSLILGEFAALLFKLPRMINQFRRYSQGLVDDTLNLKYPRFCEIRIFVPDIETQTRAVGILSTAQKEILIHEEHLLKLRTQRAGLLQKLMTGESRVPLCDNDIGRIAESTAVEAAQ